MCEMHMIYLSLNPIFKMKHIEINLLVEQFDQQRLVYWTVANSAHAIIQTNKPMPTYFLVDLTNTIP